MAAAPTLQVLPFSPRGARGERQAPVLLDGILLRCNRDNAAKR